MFEEESKEAKRRNLQILQEIGQALSPVAPTSRSASKASLQEAKRKYVRTVEEILPRWKQQQMEAHHETLRRLQTEKELARERRSRIDEERIREERARIAVEQERRELAMMLALESRDKIRANAQAAILKTQGRAVDLAIGEELERFRQDVGKLVISGSQLEEPTQEAIRSNFKYSDEGILRSPELRQPSSVSVGDEEALGRYSPHKILPEAPGGTAAPADDFLSPKDDSGRPNALPRTSDEATGVQAAGQFGDPGVLDTAEPTQPRPENANEDGSNAQLSAELASVTSDLHVTTVAETNGRNDKNLVSAQPSQETVVATDPKSASISEDEASIRIQEFSLTDYSSILPPVLRKIESLGGTGSQSQAKKAYLNAHKCNCTAIALLSLIDSARNNNEIDQEDTLLCALAIHVARTFGNQLLPRSIGVFFFMTA